MIKIVLGEEESEALFGAVEAVVRSFRHFHSALGVVAGSLAHRWLGN